MHKFKTTLALTLAAGFAGPAAADTLLWEGGDGNWGDTNWYNQNTVTATTGPPTAADLANWGGFRNAGTDGIITVTQDFTHANITADRTSRTLNVNTGVSLTSNDEFRVANRGNEANVLTVNLNGTVNSFNDTLLDSTNDDDTTTMIVNGTLNAGTSAGDSQNNGPNLNIEGVNSSLVVNSGGVVNVGSTGTGGPFGGGIVLDGTGARLTVNSGATIDSIGKFDFAGDGGTIAVNGSGSSIESNQRGFDGLEIRGVGTNGATLDYTFDAGGVSFLDITRFSTDAGDSIETIVDADAVAGSASVGDQFLLMDYSDVRINNASSTPGDTSLLPFFNLVDEGSTVQGVLVNDTDAQTVSYRIAVIPEPASLCLLAAGGLLMLKRQPKSAPGGLGRRRR